MDSHTTLGRAQVALGLQLTIDPSRLEALLAATDRGIGRVLAERVDAIVRRERLGYYPALDYFASHAGMDDALLAQLRTVAAQIRKRVKRDVQTRLWPVFSSVQIERATTLAFTLARVAPTQPDALERLAQHYFPNVVRLELRLGTLDRLARLEEVEAFTASKVVRNLQDAFDAVSVTANRIVG
jgi:hypothetical protein